MRLPHEVMVFVRRSDTFLILHRSPHLEAYWHVVAGGVEEGESPAAAALRELREETGLDAKGQLTDLGRRFVYPLAEESANVRGRFAPEVSEVVVDAFVADVATDWEPKLNEEHDAYRWCSPDDAVALLFWPEPRELLRELAD